MSSAHYSELVEPTSIQHCVAAYFSCPIAYSAQPQIVTIRGTFLEVYSVAQRSDGTEAFHLEHEYPLHGKVDSLAVLRRQSGAPRTQRDALLLASREAKLSVVEYDATSGSLRTSSLHSWEGRAPPNATKAAVDAFASAAAGPTAAAAAPPKVIADPDGRAAAVLLSNRGEVALLRAAGAGFGEADDDGSGPLEAAAISSSTVLDLRPHGVTWIRDAAFLECYAEPVLLVLHETRQTWAGSLGRAHDPGALLAFSLDLATSRHTLVWSHEALPYGLSRLYAVPPPLGGAVVLGLNHVLYRSQTASVTLTLSQVGMGASASGGAGGANPFTAGSSTTSANPPPAVASGSNRAGVDCELDRACVGWLPHGKAGGPVHSGTLAGIVCSKAGALLSLALRHSARGLSSMTLEPAGAPGAAAAAVPQCVALAVVPLSPRLLLFPSRAGPSLLVRITSADRAAGAAQQQQQPLLLLAGSPTSPSAKRVKRSGDAHRTSSLEMDEEEAFLYGEAPSPVLAAAPPGPLAIVSVPAAPAAAAAASATPVAGRGPAAASAAAAASCPRFEFRVVDSLQSLAPAVAMAVGEGPDLGDGIARPELVIVHGTGPSGGLAALSRGIRLESVTSVPLTDTHGMWAVNHRRAAEAPVADRFHSYLLLSQAGSTIVLDSGSSDVLAEVTKEAEFETAQRTVAAGNLFEGARIVQVTPRGVRVLAGPMLAQDIPLQQLAGEDFSANLSRVSIIAADVCSPFVLLRLSAGGSVGPLRVLMGNASSHRLELLPVAQSQHGLGAADFTAASLYDHTCCRCPLVCSLPSFLRARPADASADSAAAAAAAAADSASTSVFAVVARTTGAFEIWALPQARRVFATDGLADGSALLIDGPSLMPKNANDESHAGFAPPPAPEVTDVRLDAFGHSAAFAGPLLTAIRSDGQLLAWRGFHAATPGLTGLKRQLRFARVRLGDSAVLQQPSRGQAPLRLTRVERVCPGGLPAGGWVSGVFVTGPSPVWVVATQGRARAHPVGFGGRGSVSAVTHFHNVNCPHGIIVASTGGAGSVRICSLPQGLSLSGPWPARRTALGPSAEPVAVAAVIPVTGGPPNSPKCYALAVRRTDCPFRPRVAPGGDAVPGTEGAADAFREGYLEAEDLARELAIRNKGLDTDAHELRLIAPSTLECTWAHLLEPGEVVCSMVALPVRNSQTGSIETMIAVGTAFPVPDDVPCRGRLALFSVASEGGSQFAPPRFSAELVVAKFLKGPVTAIAPIEGTHRGSLLVANGTALGVHALQGAELRQVAMYLAPHVYPVFTSQLSTIKNYILLGDVHKGASFLQWKDAPSQEIALLGSTPEDLDVSAGEFLVDGPSLTIAAVDAAGTTHTYSYEPGARELTWGGKRLLSRARFAGGPPPTRSLRFPCSAAGHSGGPRQGMLFCGLTGGVAAVVPIDPGTFAALRALEDALCAAGEALVPLGAGLNPKALRWPPHRAGSARLPMSGETMLDGTVLDRFEALSFRAQHAVAAAAGHSRDALLSLARASRGAAGWLLTA